MVKSKWLNPAKTCSEEFCQSDVKMAKIKVKLSHLRPGQALRFPGRCDSQISRQSAHEGGKVVSLTDRPPIPPVNIPGTHFC